jgi:peptidyl-prolyl cis-trans isomerase C
LRELIVSALLTQYAADHKIIVTDEEKEKEFDRVRKSYPDDLTFRASLTTEGQTLDEWKARLSQSVLERKVFANLTPTTSTIEKTAELEARKYYESHSAEFDRPAEIHLQQILVAKEDDAERISHALKAGGVSFASMAKKYSLSPDAVDGGDVGYIAKGVVAAFDGAFNLKPGQLTGVVKSSYGFHIMKVLDKRPAGRLPFEKVKERLLREALGKKQQATFDQWLEGAVKAAKIERNDTLLDRIKVRTEAEDE